MTQPAIAEGLLTWTPGGGLVAARGGPAAGAEAGERPAGGAEGRPATAAGIGGRLLVADS